MVGENTNLLIRLLLLLIACMVLASTAFGQDLSPIRKYHVWLPMTGFNEKQLNDARAAGYDTVMLKIHPSATPDGSGIDFASMDKQVDQVTAKGFKVVLAILGWVGLGEGKFWDVDDNGNKVPNQLDPFWPEAMQRVEWYYEKTIDHYKTNPSVVAFAPTWGIYGEAGFTTQEAGRSPNALARFNEWRAEQGMPALDVIPNLKSGPTTDFCLFARFRFIYMEDKFTSMIRRLKPKANNIPVGMWQEMYPVIGYLWTMVEVPSAEFALYESCFPFQANHTPESSLGETMGLRYRCTGPSDYRDYYLPLCTRKRGEGQRFMGCQLTNDYAKNYGWSMEKAEKARFDQWEDDFGPVLKTLLDTPLESPKRDVLLVFPTYAASALSGYPVHFCDVAIMDVLLRSYGCQMKRYGSPKLDKMTVADMNKFKLIIVPEADYILSSTYEKLKQTTATVVFTGSFGRAIDGQLLPMGQGREIDGIKLSYYERPAADITVSTESALTRGLKSVAEKIKAKMPKDEAFKYESKANGEKVVLKCGTEPLLSTADNGRMIFIHGHIFAGLCNNPNRKPPANLSGSNDPSANEVDMWGPYDSTVPGNAFGMALMKNILNTANVDYRVHNPKPRTVCKYLADHMEQASISANLVYNNMGEPQTLTVRTPYAAKGYESKLISGRYETTLTVPPFSYIGLQPDKSKPVQQ